MTTRITKVDDQASDRAILKVEGTVTPADAALLESLCSDLREQLGRGVTIDLSGVGFLGNESAAILCRVKALPDVVFQGMHLFVEQIIEMTEAAQNARKKDS